MDQCLQNKPTWNELKTLGVIFSREAGADQEAANTLPSPLGCTSGGKCGRFMLTLPTLCVLCELSFPRLSRQGLGCNYRHVFFSCNRAAHTDFHSYQTVPTRWWQLLAPKCCFPALSLSIGHVHGIIVLGTGLYSSNSQRQSPPENCLRLGQDFQVNSRCL